MRREPVVPASEVMTGLLCVSLYLRRYSLLYADSMSVSSEVEHLHSLTPSLKMPCIPGFHSIFRFS